MAKCQKCNAELGFGTKFCTGCGMPVLLANAETPYAPPVSHVNPFATTASPNAPIAAPSEAELAKALGEVAKAAGDSAPVSPLATSGALSERGSFQQVAAGVNELRSASSPPPAPEAAPKKPGTQMMPNAPARPAPPSSPEASPTPNKVPQRTVAMNASSLVPNVPVPTPASNSAPSSSSGQYNAVAPVSQGSQGGRPAGPYPGAHVLVTWSNGQRYPATVSQVNGSQCFVVFPDGQQHWVDVMYLSPA